LIDTSVSAVGVWLRPGEPGGARGPEGETRALGSLETKCLASSRTIPSAEIDARIGNTASCKASTIRRETPCSWQRRPAHEYPRRLVRAVLVLGVVVALAGCDVGDDDAEPAAPTAESTTTVAAPATPELAIFVTYGIMSVPPVPSGLHRATGTFTTTGSVADSGSAALVYRITARGPDTIRGEETFRGEKGTLVVRFQASAVPVGERKLNERPGPTRVYGVGASRIDHGSRAYDRLRGRTGTIGYTIDFGRRTTSSLQTFSH
jgi:hypothetical protein